MSRVFFIHFHGTIVTEQACATIVTIVMAALQRRFYAQYSNCDDSVNLLIEEQRDIARFVASCIRNID